MAEIYSDVKGLIVVLILFSMSMSLFKLGFEMQKWEYRDSDEKKKH